MAISRRRLVIGILTTVVGLAAGALTNAWFQRASPSIEVTSIEIRDAKDVKDKTMVYDSAIQDLSRRSFWADTLGATGTVEDFEKTVSQLKQSVESLRLAADFSAAQLSFLQDRGSSLTKADYAASLLPMDEDKLSTLATVAATLAGMLAFADISYSDLGISDADLDAEIAKDLNAERSDSIENMVLDNILGDPFDPSKLIKMYTIALENMEGQLPINEDLLKRLTALESSGKRQVILLTATYVNSGGSAVSFDKFASICIKGLNSEIFLVRSGSQRTHDNDDAGEAVAEQVDSYIVLNPGASMSVTFASVDEFAGEQSTGLQKLYSDPSVSIVVTTRILSDNLFSLEWVSSREYPFSPQVDDIRAAYKVHSKWPSHAESELSELTNWPSELNFSAAILPR